MEKKRQTGSVLYLFKHKSGSVIRKKKRVCFVKKMFYNQGKT
jgi:hypothetical protein